jgi:hypothetical protein
MSKGEGNQSQGVVKDFALRMASKQKKSAQLDMGGDDASIDSLFKPEPMKSKHKHKPDIGGDAPDIGDELGGDIGDEMGEEKSPLDEIKEQIDSMDLSPDDLDQLCDFITEKRVSLTDDGLDTEMDRGEAEKKDEMRKDDGPLGGEGNAAMGYGGGAGGAGGAGAAPKATGTPM